MVCKKCGNNISCDMKFCDSCGSEIIKDVSDKSTSEKVSNKSGLKIASIILGIIGIVLFLVSPIAFILSLIGLILAICSVKKVKNVAGIVLNSIGLFLSIVSFSFFIVLVSFIVNLVNGIDTSYVEDAIVSYDSGYVVDGEIFLDSDGNYSLDLLLDYVDDKILSELYPEDKSMKKYISETSEYYYSAYESLYGYDKDQFLNENGFSDEVSFLNYLRLDYRRNLYFEDYVNGLVTEEEIKTYYRDEVFGDVDSKHILVRVGDDGFSDDEARKMALEIIEKLNNGSSWDMVIKEYGDKIVSEELGYMPFNASLEETYLKECRDLKIGTYSKTPVLTSYGYHIVYKINQKETPKLNEIKEDIINEISDIKISNDEYLYYKALIYMREEADFEIYDDYLLNEYNEYKSDKKISD